MVVCTLGVFTPLERGVNTPGLTHTLCECIPRNVQPCRVGNVPDPHTGAGVRFKFLAWNQPSVGCERLNTKFPPETGEDFLFAVHGRETCVGQSPPCFLLKLRFNGFAARTRRVQKVLV